MLTRLKQWMSATQQQGDAAEQLALEHLRQSGLELVCRNYRALNKTTGKLFGEIDLIMRTREGTLVFVEVRERSSAGFGGAAQSVTANKQARLIRAAQHYLANLKQVPACRFDVVAIDKEDKMSGQASSSTTQPPKIDWILNAFEAN